MDTREALFEYCLRIGDNSMVLGHRMSEWCSRGPILEEDIAMTNISLDLFGQCRNIFTYAGDVEGKGRDEDALAYHRPEHHFRSVLLTEQPNDHFGTTMARQMLFSVFHYYFYKELAKSNDEHLAAFAAKSLKETTYHMRHSSEWVIRLGDGTEESHAKMQEGLNKIWSYRHELFEKDAVEEHLIGLGIAVDTANIRDAFDKHIAEVISRATLEIPEEGWLATGGRKGYHSEYLGHILAEFQSLARAYPDAKW